jgi:transposase
MSGKVTPVQKIKEIRRLKELGLSDRAIARALDVNRRTVEKYRDSAKEQPADASGQPDAQPEAWYEAIDWPAITSEIRKGVPIQVLWEELREQKLVAVQYAAFWKQLRRRVPNLEVTMVRTFAPGDRCEIDYADGIDLLDRFTAEIIKTHLFVGVLCHSRFIFAEFSLSQKSADFLASHVRMFQAFGGVPKVVAPDNLKSAVIKAHRYDPVINPAYTKLCDYYDTACRTGAGAAPQGQSHRRKVYSDFSAMVFLEVQASNIHEPCRAQCLP